MWKLNRSVERITVNGIRKVARNGSNTSFWEDTWLGDEKLMEHFPRLYSISQQHNTIVANCRVWDGSK